MTILEVQHIEKHFGDTRVLSDISFSLEEGQALSIIGSSGSGKTTLLRCLNFLERPDYGSIAVNRIFRIINAVVLQLCTDADRSRLGDNRSYPYRNVFHIFTLAVPFIIGFPSGSPPGSANRRVLIRLRPEKGSYRGFCNQILTAYLINVHKARFFIKSNRKRFPCFCSACNDDCFVPVCRRKFRQCVQFYDLLFCFHVHKKLLASLDIAFFRIYQIFF